MSWAFGFVGKNWSFNIIDQVHNKIWMSSVKLSTMETIAAEKIESNDDVLMSILVRLPPKFVFRFRCVSNRWNNIIVGHYFLRSYSATKRKDHLQGASLLASLQLTLHDISVRRFMAFRVDTNTELVPSKLGKFIISSNGLILCGEHSSNTYHVWNPLKQKSVSLPPPEFTERTYEGTFIGFVCEENTKELVPNYTVLRGGQQPVCGGPRDTTMDLETYSSRTGMWAKSTLFSSGIFYLPVEQPPPFVFNGVMHLMVCKSIALYDINGGGNHLQLIKLPVPGGGRYIDSSFTRSERDDVLWFVVTDFDHGMQFWMLPKNKDGSYMRSTTIPADEWRLMHTITANSLLKELAIPLLGNNDGTNGHLDSIWLEGLIPYASSPIVVIRVGGRVFLYNLVTKSIALLHYDDGSHPTKWLYPYMESPYLSSYAL